jgi:hypothetical protein
MSIPARLAVGLGILKQEFLRSFAPPKCFAIVFSRPERYQLASYRERGEKPNGDSALFNLASPADIPSDAPNFEVHL